MMTDRFIYPFQFRLSITHVCNWLSLDKGAKFCWYKRYLFYNDCCKELNTSKDVLLKKTHCFIIISCSCRDSKYCKYLYKNIKKNVPAEKRLKYCRYGVKIYPINKNCKVGIEEIDIYNEMHVSNIERNTK